MIGALLVVASVVLGARVVATADRARSWVVTRSDLPAGHVLTAGDLGTTSGRLAPGAAGHYFDASATSSLIGHELSRPVAAGEMLGRGALRSEPRQPSRVVPLVVKAGRLPELRVGDRVDVYVLARTAGGDPAGREVRVAAGAEFLGQQELGSGSGVAVQVRVAGPAAAALVAASQSERVDVVRIDPGAGGELGDAGQSSIPAYGS